MCPRFGRLLYIATSCRHSSNIIFFTLLILEMFSKTVDQDGLYRSTLAHAERYTFYGH